MNPMRILGSYDKLLPNTDADAECIYNVGVALARRGHDYEILIPNNPKRATPDAGELNAYYMTEGPIRVRGIPSFHPNVGLQMVKHARLLAQDSRASEVDFVHVRNFTALVAALAAGRKVLWDHYRPWGDQVPPMQPLLRAALTHPNCIGAVIQSRYAYDAFCRIGIPAERMEPLYNGYDPRRMEPVLSKREARLALELPQDRTIAVYSGRMTPKKGLGIVMKAAKRCPEVLFLLVGSEGQGPIEREAAAIDNIQVAPWQDFKGMTRYLYAADMLVIPPASGPLTQRGNTIIPLKLYVYLGAGRALLAPDVPDNRELLVDGENSVLVTPDDLEKTVETIQRLHRDEAFRTHLEDGALETAKSLTYDARVDVMERFLEPRLAAHHQTGRWTARRWLAESGRWLVTAMKHRQFVVPVVDSMRDAPARTPAAASHDAAGSRHPETSEPPRVVPFPGTSGSPVSDSQR